MPGNASRRIARPAAVVALAGLTAIGVAASRAPARVAPVTEIAPAAAAAAERTTAPAAAPSAARAPVPLPSPRQQPAALSRYRLPANRPIRPAAIRIDLTERQAAHLGAPRRPAPAAPARVLPAKQATTPAPRPAPAPAATTGAAVPTASAGPPAPVDGSAGSRIIAEARRYLGVAYVTDGATPAGFDCSGYTMWVYSHAGVASLPHNAQAQREIVRIIPRATARPGDLIFYLDGSAYAYHVAIYAGGNAEYAAPAPGQDVKLEGIWDSHILFGTDWH